MAEQSTNLPKVPPVQMDRETEELASKIAERAREARHQAAPLPEGPVRDPLLEKIKQCDTDSRFDRCRISLPGQGQVAVGSPLSSTEQFQRTAQSGQLPPSILLLARSPSRLRSSSLQFFVVKQDEQIILTYPQHHRRQLRRNAQRSIHRTTLSQKQDARAH